MSAAQLQVLRLLDELAANGGFIIPRANQQDGLPRFLLEVGGGGDRYRCRRIVAELKADPNVLRAAIARTLQRSIA